MGLSKRKLGDYRVRVKFKQNVPTSDNAGGSIDSFEDVELSQDVFEVWAYVKTKSASRTQENEQVQMLRTYEIRIRSNFDNTAPVKNQLVEIIGFSTNDATVQSVIWDDWNSEFLIEATERL